ncbi:MAG TPA: family 10 glycosylhydrolase [Tepidisphaeraceae bacterium]|nr:family 10 glycosylhydrolase [Tepidisphaeraceae bacterium]
MKCNALTLAAVLVALAAPLSMISCRGNDKNSGGAKSIAAPGKSADASEPPPAMREFRAAWVATVGNIDWPSRPGLTTEQQQKEAIQILDRSKEINLNAIVLQVRTTADALYESKLEPWSAFLTGTMGKAPDPYYDPLKFWIEQAHARGIELHAWFNPYRTRYQASKVVPSENHISRTRPDLAKDYGRYGWMDPGEPESADHSFAVFMDVVERYDVDGIHIDDYFYPYPDADPQTKKELPFPDDASYKKYTDAGGKLPRNDWRRDNINQLIKRIYDGTKQRKRHVKFGISPFGIPRPGLPGIEYVKGFDQYEKLYADTVLWLKNGWCDYFSPQLYWKIGAPQQPYLGLLEWWADHNPKHRHLYPGLFTSKIDWSEASWSPDEIIGQVMITRLTAGAHGNVHFSQIALSQNRKKLAELLRDGLYAQPALVPASTWLDSDAPAAPRDVKAEQLDRDATRPIAAQTTGESRGGEARGGDRVGRRPATAPFLPLAPPSTTSPAPRAGSVRVSWSPGDGREQPFLWAVYYKQGSEWKLKVVPSDQGEAVIADSPTAGPATRVSVSAVDRSGNESKRTTIDTGFAKESPEKIEPTTAPSVG